MSNININYTKLAEQLQSFDGSFKHLKQLIEYSSNRVYCGWVIADAEQAISNIEYTGNVEEKDLVAILEMFERRANHDYGIAWYQLEEAAKEYFKVRDQ